jgi:hypothetical protein
MITIMPPQAAPPYFSIILNVTFSDRYFPVILTVTAEKLRCRPFRLGGDR